MNTMGKKKNKKTTPRRRWYEIKRIVFLDDNSDRIKIITNPPSNFRIPRVGEHVTLFIKCASLVVINVSHAYEDGEILIFTDYYNNFKSYEETHRTNNTNCAKGIVQHEK